MKTFCKLTFIADTHHYSKTLGTTGEAYEYRSGSDQKCLAETGDIIDAAFEQILTFDTDAVIIAGDVSNDGERVSHEEFREKLNALDEKLPVYLITATHDWCCDGNPRAYEGKNVIHDVPTVPHEELREFYYRFATGKSIAEYVTHLGVVSYVAQLCDGVRLLALNDDQNGKGRAGFTEEHFQWVEEQIKKAKEDGQILIGMEHHLIIAHTHPFITGGGTCVGDREIHASRLADAGLKYMFVGHSHFQAISSFTSEKGNTIYQVNIGALTGYPAPMVNVTVTDEGLDIDTVLLERFNYNGQEQTLEYLKQHAYNVLDRPLTAAATGKEEFLAMMNALGVHSDAIGKAYFAIKPLAKLALNGTVWDAYKKVNRLTFGRVLEKEDALELKDKKIIDIIHEVWLNILDGCRMRVPEDSAYFRLVTGIVGLPHRLLKNVKIFRELEEVIVALLKGGEFDSYKTFLKA